MGIPKGACRGKYGQIHCKTTFLPLGRRVFLFSKRTIFFLLGVGDLDVAHWEGQTSGPSGW